MKKFLFALVVLAIAFQGCKKDADNWVGTYNGQSGQNIQRVIISKASNSTLKVELQSVLGSLYLTYAVIDAAKITSATNVEVDEDGQLAGDPATYKFKGTATRNGNSISILGSATNKNNANDVKYYSFNGTK